MSTYEIYRKREWVTGVTLLRKRFNSVKAAENYLKKNHRKDIDNEFIKFLIVDTSTSKIVKTIE